MKEEIKKISADIPKKVVAVCGKGGVGKTVFSAMMTKSLVESKRLGKLLVIDADPALGLSNALGITVEQTIGQVRESIIETAMLGTREDKSELAGTLDYMLFEALIETDDFAFLAMGRSEAQGCFCPVNSILRASITVLSDMFDTILIDGEAGLEQINRQVVRHVDTLIVLTDTSSRGRQTVEHIKKLVEDEQVIDCRKIGVVFNRVQGDEDILLKSAKNIGIDVFGFIPQDTDIVEYDLVGRPLINLPLESPAYTAVRSIIEKQFFQDGA